ncbi:MAG: NADH-quinone oxidoreductase subunit N [Acidimicrobiia bacterium]
MPTPEVSWLAILPELVLALAAVAVLLAEVQWKPPARVLGFVAGTGLLLTGAATLWQWRRAMDVLDSGVASDLVAFSGMIFVDGFAVFARMALVVVTALGLVSAWSLLERSGTRRAEAIALVLLATAGFSIMVASNNLVMLFLGLEVGSIALYVLAGFTRDSLRSDEAAIKYFLLGSFASAIFIYGVALLYAGTGQLEIVGLRGFFATLLVLRPGVILVGLGLVIVGLAFKVSAAPFHTWAPDVYQGAPAGLVGYMAAMAKIAGFAAIARILITGLSELEADWLPIVATLSVLSMLVGSVLALVQSDVRRLLAYSGVAHAGFIMTGIVGGVTDGILFYVAAYALQLVGAFAVVAEVGGPGGTESPIDDYRGLARRSPGLAAAFTVLLLGMAGLPLTSGFVAKFGVFANAWNVGYQWLVIVAVLASVIAFAFYLRVIVVMYMDEVAGDSVVVSRAGGWVLALTVAATVAWGVFPGLLIDLVANAFAL